VNVAAGDLGVRRENRFGAFERPVPERGFDEVRPWIGHVE
jgi:hypothetical protein